MTDPGMQSPDQLAIPAGRERDLTGQSALVTGATSGIGRAAAYALAALGANVVIHGRDAERGAATVSEITDAGGSARFISADLTDLNHLRRLAMEVGPLDILVNNAGFSWFGPTQDLEADTFDRLFAANVRAPYFLVAAVAPMMADRGSGNIINVASMAGTIGLPTGAAYSATKAALTAMTRAWAAEYSPRGVRVNAVAPGPVYTDGAVPERIEALGRTTLLGRGAGTAEVAETISFLASPRSSYTTGATLAVDGGRTAI
jgi:NAD(P)-dependent dehydrogenase (short-subunit alcohol dehydrogenase family)